jgi:hypothetical protein
MSARLRASKTAKAPLRRLASSATTEIVSKICQRNGSLPHAFSSVEPVAVDTGSNV